MIGFLRRTIQIDIIILFQTTCLISGRTNPENGSWAHRILSNLGISIMPDRRLCFSGRVLRGLVWPDNEQLQQIVLKQFVVWYSPCIGVADTRANSESRNYYIKKECFLQRENQLMKAFLKYSAWKISQQRGNFKED